MVQLFGTTIRETLDAFRPARLGTKKKPPTPTETEEKPPAPKGSENQVKAIGRLVVSVLLIAVGAYLAGKEGAAQAAGTGLLGTVAGYWLK